MADNGEKEKVMLTIDGQEVTVNKGTTVLEAAMEIGVEIPYFCWHPKLDSIGACRMCLVAIEKIPKPAVACATEVMPGMVVRTDTDEIIKARRGVLEFLLLNHPLDCPTCDKGGECDLQNNVFNYGIDKSRQTFTRMRVVDEQTKTTFDDKKIGPEIWRNMNRCVTCFKCVRFNKEIAGEFDLGAYQRGNHTVIDTPPGEQISNIYSGNVVEICPVGALTNTDWRYKVRVWKTSQADSISSHDSDGQNITLWYDRRKVWRATSRRNDDIDEGWICDITRYGYQYVNSPNRLLKPLVKKQGKQVETTWPEAIDLIARRFKEIKDNKGAVCIAGLAGGNESTETYYLFNRFFRQVLHSNSVDYRMEFIDLRDGEKAQAYNALFEAPFKIAELEKADTVLIFGSNLIKEHPVVNLWLRKANRKNNAKIFTANPVETKSADISIDELVYQPETETAFLIALQHAIIDQKFYKNIDESRAVEIKSKLNPGSLSEAAQICGIDAERIVNLAKALSNSTNLYLIAGDFLKALPRRYAPADAFHNLANLLGVADDKAIIMASQANAMGAHRVGLRPSLPPYLKEQLESKWDDTLPDSEGSNASRIFKGALEEEIDAVFVLGANPAMRYPDGPFVNAALDKLDFLVVADLFESATTQKADVVLPLAGWSEQVGSFVNLEGRYQQFDIALPAPDGVKSGIEIVKDIARAVGSPIDVEDQKLETETRKIIDAWQRQPRDLNKFYEVRYVSPVPHEGFPYRLLLGNDLHHFGYLTEYCESLMRFTPEPYLEISPNLAEKLEIEEGSLVRIESDSGKLVLKAKISRFFEGEVLFIPNNFAATEVNSLITHENCGWVKIEKLDDK
jgi:NADH-quinone oxidoreductase chain G